MGNDTVLMFYECDVWHTRSSMNLLGAFSDMLRLEDYLDKMRKDKKITEDDIEELRHSGQTQGKEINYYIDTQILNPEYE